MAKKIAILVGGSDLFSGLRGLSRTSVNIRNAIQPIFDDVKLVNYNYFLDGGRTIKGLFKQITQKHLNDRLFLYGYSKGGEVVLQLCRQLEATCIIHLLVTVDIANGPWSHLIDRAVPSNVLQNINVFQRNPVFPLRSYGLPAYAEKAISIENIDLTDALICGKKINHSNIEYLVAPRCIEWLSAAALNHS